MNGRADAMQSRDFETTAVLDMADTSMSDGREQPTKNERAPASVRRFVYQAVLGTALIMGLILGAAYFFRAPLERFSNWLVETAGLFGLVLGVLATDAFAFPVPPDTYLFIAVASDASAIPVLLVISATSVVAGTVAFGIGPYIERIPLLRRRIAHFRERGEALFGRYGAWTIAIAALTPIPFSVVCWMAGLYRMSYRTFFLASLTRVPRFMLYYVLFLVGWDPNAV